MSEYYRLDTALFFKWLSHEKELVLIKTDELIVDNEEISYLKVNFTQALVLSKLDGATTNASVAQDLSEQFGGDEIRWLESIEVFTIALHRYSFLVLGESPKQQQAFMPFFSLISSPSIKELNQPVKVIKKAEQIQEAIYAEVVYPPSDPPAT